MVLEARSVSWFSRQFVLTLDDDPLGGYDLQPFGRAALVRLNTGERMRFERKGWSGFRVRLLDGLTNRVIAEAGPRLFRRAWGVQLSVGPVRLERNGRVCEETGPIAFVELAGFLWRGWRVHANVGLSLGDLIFLGMAYSERRWWRSRHSFA